MSCDCLNAGNGGRGARGGALGRPSYDRHDSTSCSSPGFVRGYGDRDHDSRGNGSSSTTNYSSARR